MNEYTWTVDLRLLPGEVLRDQDLTADRIASHFRARRGSVDCLSREHEGDWRIVRTISNPFPKTDMPTHSLPDEVSTPIVLGTTSDRAAFSIRLDRHTLIAGMSGSGKSGVLNVMLANLSRMRNVAVWGIDLKGGVEMNMWSPVLSEFAKDVPEAVRMLNAVITEVHRREGIMRERNIRKWVPTREDPSLFVIIDEFAELTSGARGSGKTAEMLATIARTARAAGVWLVLATQLPMAHVIPNQIRSQMMTIISLRVQRREHNTVIFGSDSADWATNRFDPTVEGLLHVMTSPQDRPEKVRGYWVSDDLVRDMAASSLCTTAKASFVGLDEAAPAAMTLDEGLRTVLSRAEGPMPAAQIYEAVVKLGVAIVAKNEEAAQLQVQRRLKAVAASAGWVKVTGAGPSTRYELAAVAAHE